MRLRITVKTQDGQIHKQPNCRIKTDCNGNVMALVLKNDVWVGVKAEVTIRKVRK